MLLFVAEKMRKKGADAFSELPLQYFGVSSKVMKSISVSCILESSKLCTFQKTKRRRWERHAEIVLNCRIPVSENTL